ncbi:MAG: SpoIIE family protein phosphatase [Clostridia bacterium]|nr:SpoIIE family protein phosphatase [Clostridia bacterium]
MEQRSIANRAKEMILPYVRRREFRYELALMGFSFLLGSVVLGGRIAPVAPAMTAAAWLSGRNPYYALCGAVLGAAFRGRVDSVISPIVYLMLCLLWRAWRGELKKTHKFLMLPVSQFLMMPFFYMSNVEDCVIGLLQATLTVIFAGILQQGLLVIRSMRLRRILMEAEQVSLILLSGITVLAVAGFAPMGLSLGTIAAVFLCLMFAYCRGSSATAAAVLLGAAMVLSGGLNVLFIGSFALCTLCAATLRPLGRVGISAGFLAAALLIRAYAGNEYSLAIPELCLGLAVFLMLPKRWVQPLSAMVDMDLKRERSGRRTVQRLREHTGRQLLLTADVFREVADLFARRHEKPDPENDRRAVTAGAAMCVCADCSRADQCWKDARSAAEAFLKYQRGGGERLPAPLSEKCLRKNQLRRTVDAAMEQYRAREEQIKRNENCLAFTHRQLTGVCSVMHTISEETKRDSWYDEELEARLRICLDKAHIRVRELDALREAKKLRIRVLLADTKDRERTAACIFRALRRKLRVSSTSPEELYFSDRPKFDAKSAFAVRSAPQSRVSGDSVGIRESGDGKLMVLLSDGMGTGAEAHSESAAAVNLLGDLLCVGFDSGIALESVNRLLIARGTEDMYATLDGMLLDMNTGIARFLKFGAPPSYILREGKVYTLYCEALPAGILEEAQAAVQQVRLRQGDSIIMLTDGVADALGSGLHAAIIERVGSANTVQDAANALVAAALEEGAEDDLSAAVIRI